MSVLGARMCLLGAFVAGICTGGASIATVPQRAGLAFELKLSESALFQQLACIDRYGVLLDKAEAVAYTGPGKLEDSTYVSVLCRPHRRIEGQPVKYLVECARADPADLASAWECPPGRERMLARVGGILVQITMGLGSTAKLDDALVIVRQLRSRGQLKDDLVEEPRVPGEEGFVSCHTDSRYSDHVEVIRCPGVDDVPLATAR
jgi:hypothetical protein